MQGGQWEYYKKRGQRHKLVARRYVLTMLERGKIHKKPCNVCGSLDVQAHHNSYENPLDIDWLCKDHHDALHAWLRSHRKKIVVDAAKSKA